MADPEIRKQYVYTSEDGEKVQVLTETSAAAMPDLPDALDAYKDLYIVPAIVGNTITLTQSQLDSFEDPPDSKLYPSLKGRNVIVVDAVGEVVPGPPGPPGPPGLPGRTGFRNMHLLLVDLVGQSVTIDLSDQSLLEGDVFKFSAVIDLGVGVVNAVVPMGKMMEFEIHIEMGSTPKAVTWLFNIDWIDNNLPELVANKISVIVLRTVNGTLYQGNLAYTY
ncbi:MAG: hypothetical protein FWG61_00510 [Firmicutes bacterium]|nr:hypothetical protein [Bacillota bacterium]